MPPMLGTGKQETRATRGSTMAGALRAGFRLVRSGAAGTRKTKAIRFLFAVIHVVARK